MKNNRIAVLLSAYNGEEFIDQQINSLLHSSVEVDIYIRDDGSSDKTQDIVSEYISKHKNIYLLPRNNVGVVASFFELILHVDETKYDYFCFCDQDDFWEKDKIEVAVDKIKEKNGAVMYCSALNVVDENLNFKFKSCFPSRGVGLSNALVENIVTGCTVVLNKEAFVEIKNNIPDPTCIVMHDWWFYLIMSVRGEIIFDSNSYIKYRQHGKNVEGMKTPLKKIISKIKNHKKPSKYPPLLLQLKTFQSFYLDEFSPEQRTKVSEFIDILEKRRFFSFLIFILRGKVFRNSVSDNASLIYSFITGRI
ncbi:glycosyltransferase family 2 protein [Raoultella ornithinolytica]|uniref:glycosyltransferase family 2 protein n=1 Tax=Raoultella ornithinolytica TaxID=54291 RepID=UPI000F6D4632|nr:glycosyltransferase family 2 protein [Raoultella ornithinolytica]EKQ7998385.1 glycosyltransferase family 2 protein [Raoultella ornithinolytica]EKU0197069.1 glycosyltransferase family 2 protein [Raoultella ornithinolytica]EKV8287888.1 glycosyltransferase family 2 protein [Raoultella ornithinolytica]EKW3195300.1 glycosyltransferase family 2 protein [Raoultella ornithinolytica]EKW4694582.1 glycosyltransferase family 2 protein [Raoultella ornithinolytica]